MLPARPPSLADPARFDRFFSDDIALRLKEAEQLNKKARRTFHFAIAAALLTVLIPIPGYLVMGKGPGIISLFSAGVSFSAVLVLMGYHRRSAYIRDVKGILLGPILNHYGDLKHYSRGSDFESAMGNHLETILPPYDKLHMDDAVSGTYRGLKIFLSDVTAEYVMSSGKQRTTIRVFSGLVVVVSEPSDRAGDYWLKPQHLAWNLGSRNSSWFSDLERIKLESPDFEKAYDFYGTDQIEGRVIMKPALMERWTALGKLSSSDGVCANFNPNCFRLRFGLDHDWLDDSILENTEDGRAAVQSLIAEFEAVFDVIDLAFENHR